MEILNKMVSEADTSKMQDTLKRLQSHISADTFKDLKKISETYPEVIKLFIFFKDELQRENLYGQISFGFSEMFVEPSTPKTGEYDGMQLIYDFKSKQFEVSEHQAGKNKDELYIYTVTKQPKRALESLLLGNKGRKPIKIYK